jgi:rubredoxin
MSNYMITCSMCGHIYDPKGLHSCVSCPINHDCSLVCCPNCGYQAVDLEKTKIAKFISSIFGNIMKEKTLEEENM